ncbi:retrovirus-related Pol polyprotein from transposon 297 [Trichonephila clavipes]|uniref:Retrovirus-related Pol polyprotein from transposon 297 n=1 Tax=Trichonephila clavipes TaxID=2585209 RepID=A0A8X7BE37_TRICX|nr:retrovirus-related Pol polyprotein from transposon 297 [Trichonephila clavipes]
MYRDGMKGEQVWVRHLLDDHMTCLPVAEVDIECDLDACGPMPISTEGNKYLITVMCLAAKYPDAMPDIASKSVVNALLQESQVPAALFALRTVTHESTGFSPAELVYGNNLRTTVTLLYESWLDSEEKGDTVVEYVFELINRLKKCRDLATVRKEEVRDRRKKWYDKNAIKREFQQGAAVLVLSLNQPHKLAPQWKGPGKIEKRLSETNSVVTFDGNQEGNKVYHINMLKPYHRRPELLNVVLVDTEEITESSELEEDFPYMLTDPNVFDFREIVENNKLKERLSDEQIMQLGKLLVKFSAIFSNIPGKTNLVEHDIDLISDKRVQSKPYRMTKTQNEILKTEIERMLKYKIIEPGPSEYTSSMILVETSGRDPSINYRKLNKITHTEFYPIPNREQRFETVAAAKFITLIDLTKGYWQIPQSPRAQRIAAFATSFGVYRPLRIPFGLKNAPYYFSKLMSEILSGCEKYATPYLDDIAIFQFYHNA